MDRTYSGGFVLRSETFELAWSSSPIWEMSSGSKADCSFHQGTLKVAQQPQRSQSCAFGSFFSFCTDLPSSSLLRGRMYFCVKHRHKAHVLALRSSDSKARCSNLPKLLFIRQSDANYSDNISSAFEDITTKVLAGAPIFELSCMQTCIGCRFTQWR